MRLLTILFAMMCLMVANVSQAQTPTKPTTKSATGTAAITDEDLQKYAVTMDSVKSMQVALNDSIASMVQKNTVMSVQRYNDLFKIADDQAKLAEKQATPEEVKFLQDIAAKRTEEMAKVNTTYQTLVKEYVGVKTFNTIKKSLETDQELKAKYDNMSKELESKSGE